MSFTYQDDQASSFTPSLARNVTAQFTRLSQTDNLSTVSRHPAEAVIICLVLAVIIVLTIGGNLLVCVTVISSRRMHNVTNYFLLSLASSDLLLGCFVLPFSVVNTIDDRWPFGAAFCNVYTSMDVMLCTVSILTLFAISLDRYFAVTSPFRYQSTMNSRKVFKICAAIWAFSLLMAFLPIHLGWNTPDGQVQNSEAPTICSLGLNKPYVLTIALGTYFIPLCVMCMVYIKILRITRRQVREINSSSKHSLPASSTVTPSAGRRTSLTPPLSHLNSAQPRLDAGHNDVDNSSQATSRRNTSISSYCRYYCCYYHPRLTAERSGGGSVSRLNGRRRGSNQDPTQRRHRLVSDRKATVNLASVVLAFALCWIPYFVLFALKPFLPLNVNIPIHLDLFCLWLGYVNSTINPFLYAFYNSTFRDGFRRVLCRGWIKKLFMSSADRRLSAESVRELRRLKRRSIEGSLRESQSFSAVRNGVHQPPEADSQLEKHKEIEEIDNNSKHDSSTNDKVTTA